MKLLLALSILLLNTFVAYSGPIQDGVYYIINRAFLQVVQVADWSYSDGGLIGFDIISGGDNQRFRLTTVGDFYKITALHSGKVFTVPSLISTGDTSQITQWGDSGEDLQQWNIFSTDYNGFYKIQSRYSGKVLTATQEYTYWPVEWANAGTDSGPVEDAVAAPASDIADAADVADAAVGQSIEAPNDAKMSVAWPPYSVKNKIIHSIISPANTYQDFLFVKIAGYDAVVEEPVAMPDAASGSDDGSVGVPVMDTTDPVEVPAEQADPDVTDEVTSAFDFDPVENDLGGAVGQGEAASSAQDTTQTANDGFLANDTPVVEEPVEPEVQDATSVVDEAVGQN